MKIRTRLFIGFGVLIILLFAIAGVGINRFSELRSDVDEVYRDRYERVSNATSARLSMNEMAKHIANILNQGGSIRVEEELAHLSERKANTERTLSRLSDLSNDSPREQSLSLAASRDWTNFSNYVVELHELIDQNDLKGAVQLRAEVGLGYQNALQESLLQLSNYHEQQMDAALDQINEANQRMLFLTGSMTGVALFLGVAVVLWLIRSISGGLGEMSALVASISNGRYRADDIPPPPARPDEFDEIAIAFHEMMRDLSIRREKERELTLRLEEEGWHSASLAHMLELLQASSESNEAAQLFASEVVPLIGAAYGAVYLLRPDADAGQGGQAADARTPRFLERSGAYAFEATEERGFRLGEGWVGQCALDRKEMRVTGLPPGYVTLGSGTGQTEPVDLLLVPILHEGELIGVFEAAALRPYAERETRLAEKLVEVLGASVSRIRSRKRIEELLHVSQTLAEELQTQSEELQHQSEELLTQQEELRISNGRLEQQLRIIEEKKGELEENQRVLEQQKRELALSSQYKTEFLANMSHELRTPLNSMLILSQLLSENKEGNLSARQREYAETIHTSGGDLLRLIDDILDLSKVESGKMEVHPDAVSLADLTDHLRQLFAPLAAKNGVDYRVDLAPSVPPMLYTDAQRLQQILKNLLGNAFKFTPQGSVTLLVSAAIPPGESSEATAAPSIAFEVKDTGIGISAEKQGLIFEAFRQADGTTGRRYGGTGLGLSISLEMARLLGGSIRLHSEPGKGSAFTLTIPQYREELAPADLAFLEQAHREAAPAGELETRSVSNAPAHPGPPAPSIQEHETVEGEEARLETSRFAGKSILLVDDDIRNVFALSSFLESCGMTVTFAENGLEALEQLRANPAFDLVLMDIMMPEMDGYEAMRRIREQPAFAELPIIALTAKAMREDRARCMENGASDYMAKPIDTAQLVKLLNVWLYK
ncbi:response regulator [Gorillibacterium sp. CAU 1737]|uniref:response regulator n=1 Tax=Gorillibacterium sp. CAU 1737 TaxID=3140362 RepID=UPI00326117FF